MLETATSIELQNLTQHLVRQPTPAATLAEFVHHLRTNAIPIAWPEKLPGDLSPREINTTEPLIVHLPGATSRAVIIGVGFEAPEAPVEDFGMGARLRPAFGADVIQEYDRKTGLPRSIFGPGALTTAAPLAIAAWLVRELKRIGDNLPGHVLLVVAPGAQTGGEAFEAAGERLQDIIHRKRLRPILALVPGRVRPGASARKRQHIVVTTGSAGMTTVQLFIAGQTAAPGARMRALDPNALCAALVQEFSSGDGSRPLFGHSLPPPVISDQSCGISPAPGWPPPWAAARLTFFTDKPDPQDLLSMINTTAMSVFTKHVASLTSHFGRQRFLGGGDSATMRALSIQPQVLAYRELRRTCRYEMPAVQPTPDGLSVAEQLRHVQDQALRRVRFAWEHSPTANTPMIVVSLAPPLLPPYRLDSDEEFVAPVLKKTAGEYQALRSRNGLLVDAWQRLALSGWTGRHARTAQDEMPLADQPPGFGLRTVWSGCPLVGFGPAGRDAGARSECVDIEPSFTRLPEYLRTLVVRVLAQDERPGGFSGAISKLRKLSVRLGLSRRPGHEEDDDDDEKLFPGLAPRPDDPIAELDEQGESSDNHHPASAVGKPRHESPSGRAQSIDGGHASHGD
ncbi:MAG: hypothetical protein AB7K09_03780 [Planctomycetota bacterium]